jgi:hypothetical protein
LTPQLLVDIIEKDSITFKEKLHASVTRYTSSTRRHVFLLGDPSGPSPVN